MKSLNPAERVRHIALRTLKELYLLVNAALMLFPLVYLIISSGKSSSELLLNPFGFPSSWSNFAANYASVITGEVELSGGLTIQMYTPFFTMLKNVVILTVCSLVFLIVCATPIGYAMGRRQFRGKTVYLLFVIFIQTVPLFGYLIAFYYLMDLMAFTDSLLGIALIYAGVSMPGAIIFMRGFFAGFPGEIEEAAEIDGAGEATCFFRIVVPMARGIIFAIVLVNFMGYWNEFAIANMLITNPSLRTISVNIMMTADAGARYNTYTFALLTLSAIPTFLFFTIFQKGITSGGLTLGSLKG